MKTNCLTLIFDLLGFTFILALALGNAHADTRSIDSTELSMKVEHFISQELLPLAEKQHRYDVNIGNIPPRLAFHKCETDIALKLRRDIYQSPNNTIDIQCKSPSWQLFVPIDIEVYGKIVVAATSIPKNTVIRPDHLELKEQQINISRYASYDSIGLVSGMVAKRSIRQGAAITPSRLQPPRLISRGDQVIISAKSSAIAIQMKGEALNSGVLGEQISVKNLSSNRVIRAQVVERGRVAVLM